MVMTLATTDVAADPITATPMKIGVVMPAYNAERTLEKTYGDLPHDMISQVILVDDASKDRTIEVAKTLPISVFSHVRNYGYGGNQKTCYTEALKMDLDVVVMLHPDYQYDPKLLPLLVQPILDGKADVVFGSRMQKRGDALKQGMPWWKYVSNIGLTAVENGAFGLALSEYHTGYRAFHRRVLERVNYHSNSDNFIFDQQIVAQIVNQGFRIAEVYVPAKYFPEASSVGFLGSCVYGFSILALVAEYLAFKSRLLRPARYLTLGGRYQRVK
jgi:glycosyltransferase involved in cell wall biosynthesis